MPYTLRILDAAHYNRSLSVGYYMAIGQLPVECFAERFSLYRRNLGTVRPEIQKLHIFLKFHISVCFRQIFKRRADEQIIKKTLILTCSVKKFGRIGKQRISGDRAEHTQHLGVLGSVSLIPFYQKKGPDPGVLAVHSTCQFAIRGG